MTRKILKPLLLASVASLGLIGSTLAVSAETLADALVSAYRNSHLLEQNRAALRAADEDVAQAVADLRPVLQWTANYGYTKNDATAASYKAAGKTYDRLTAYSTLVASVTLFDFGRGRLAVDMKKEAVLSTREGLRSVEQQVLLSAISAYTSVKSTAEQVAINENSVRVIGEQLKAAQDRFDVGEVTKTDVSQAEASLAGARASLAAARGNYTIARESYKAAIGHYPEKLSALPKAPVLPKSLDTARSTALRAHPSIKQAQHSVSLAELSVSAAAAERLPTIDGSASVTLYEGGTKNTAAGVGLTQTLYTGGKLSSVHRQAIAGRDQAKAALREAGVEVSDAVAQAWASIDVYRAQIRAYDEQIQAADIAYKGVKEEATLGARTTLDVLDAEQTLLDARASRITAEADLQVGYYSLLSAMGLLTVEDLKLGIPTYDPAGYYNAVQKAPITSVQGKSLDRVLSAIGKN